VGEAPELGGFAGLLARVAYAAARGLTAAGPPALVATIILIGLFAALYLLRLVKWDAFRQAAIVLGSGYAAAAAFSAWVSRWTAGTELAYYTWWPILPLTAAAVILICILSSLLSIRRVVVLEPAVVFRG
jgi:putative ABC transport system permease protein